MKIKDYRDAQLHYTKDDRGDATGAFEMFVAEEPSSMVQEPRSNYSNGLKVNPVADSGKKLNEVIAAYERYRGGRKNPVINFDKFFELYAEENFAEGGQAGQLVQPNNDGSRPGYNGRGGARPNTGGDRSEFIDYEAKIKNPGKKKLDIAEKVHGNKPEYKGLKGFELWKKLKNFQRSNIREELTTGEPGFKPKKNQIGKDDFIKLVSDNKGKTYNEFVEIIKKYKTKDGQPFTKQIIADRLRAYKLSGSFKREEAQGLDKTKKAAAEKKRKLNLKEVDRTKAKGVGDFQYHHVRQIAGGVPLTTDDVLIINKRVNAQIGGATNKALNRISEAIRKNNKLALEAMNAKNEGLALEYMKRSDNLNAQAEKIVNSAIDKLPKKYKGYVGFNKFTLPRDEYGLPMQNEGLVIKKVGGMPVSKNAIDLTTLNLEQEAEFKKIVREQAAAGKTGKINLKNLNPKHQQLIKNQFCPGNRKGGVPGSCDISEAMDNMIKQTNAVKQGAIKGTEATRIANKASKVVRFGTGKGLGAVLGPLGLGGEAVFEVAMAVPGYGKGKKMNRILGDSILGLIPGVGQSAEEEFDEYATKDGMSQLEQQKIKDANRFLELNNSLPSALKNIGKGGRGDPLKGTKTFEKQYKEYEPLYNQFVGGPPSESASTAFAEQQRINDLIKADEAARAEQRDIAMDEDFMAAGGGIAGLSGGDKSGRPPESGPASQGLRSLFNNGKKR